MRRAVRDRRIVEKAVAQSLFEGVRTEKGVATPVFRPDTDEITAVGFVLTGAAPSDCKPITGFMASPDALFAALPVERRPRSREALEQSLGRALGRDCTFSSATNFAPVVTAESMLPAVAGQLTSLADSGRLFDRTVLLTVSNDVYNGFPTRELDDLVRRRGLTLNGVEDALRLTRRLAQHFQLEAPEGWLVSADIKDSQYHGLRSGVADFGPLTVRLQMSELRPTGADVASGIDFPPSLIFDRVATGPDGVRIVPATGERGDLRIIRRPRLQPLTVLIRASAEGIGRTAVPAVALDVAKCAPEICARDGDDLRINPLAALGLPQTLSWNEPIPMDRAIEVRVTFRYATGGLYDMLRLQTDWTPVRMRFVPPLVIPGSSWSPDDRRLDNATLAALWRPSDGVGLTQDAARARLLAEREQEEIVRSGTAIAGALALPATAALICVLFFYRRRFQPRLHWQPADAPTLDFENDGCNRLLLGTVTIENDAPVPWFGRLMGNGDHPHRRAELILSPPPLQQAALLVEGDHPIGFLQSSDGDLLTGSVSRDITHGSQFPVFLAAERVRDYLADHSPAQIASTVPLAFTLFWHRRRGDRSDTANEAVTLELHLRRERARPPEVRFLPLRDSAVVFERGKAQPVGTLVIESRARRRFAEAFTAQFAILARRSGLPLGDGTLRIQDAEDAIPVPSGASVTRPLLLLCDGVQVPNPDASEDVYSFRLATDAAPGSDLGPHGFLVQRDPVLCEPRLLVEWCGQRYDIFWPAQGDQAHATVTADEQGTASTRSLEENRLLLPDPPGGPRSFMLADGAGVELLRLTLGNTGRSGRGVVSFTWEWTLAEEEGAPAIEMKAARPLGDLLTLEDDHTGLPLAESSLSIAEPDEDRSLHLAAAGRAIAAIHGDRSGLLTLNGRLRIHRRNDRGEEWSGMVDFGACFRLETLPPPNWLCIDFGTSAIAAALGSGDAVKLLDLQRLVPPDADSAQRQECNIADYDPLNPEVASPFLPSYVLCDADFRQGKAKTHARPGFPAYTPARLRPDDPTFLSLPAPFPELAKRPGRVIGSLKSWLGRSSATIILGEDVPYEDASGNVVEGPLPTDEVVEGAFAALASAYLDDPRHHAGRVIVTHPNTFSPVHRDRLRRCVLAGLGGRLGIHLPERIQLISESDAIAFHHCRNRQREGAPRPQERILVFDLGAGTLDLTLLKVEWSRDNGVRPKGWTVENRIGVPVAGNHLDRILAWQIDALLRRPEVVDKKRFTYAYPIVAKGFTNPEMQDKHREAVRGLALALRRAKQGDPDRQLPPWDGSAPFLVEVGGDGTDLLRAKNEAAMNSLPSEPTGSSPQLIVRGAEILLAVPAGHIHDNRALKTFVGFLTRTCIDELLDGAGRTRDDVDTVLVSGRGALWPGLRDAVLRQFPKAEAPFLHAKPNDMKEAVVRGAIAWQQLTGAARSVIDQRPPRLALLLHGDNRLIEEKDWDKPIDLSTSASFSLVQVECARPDFGRDRNTLRRHFYVDVGFGELQRDQLSLNDPTLRVRRERDRAGYAAIRLEGSSASRTLGIAGTAGAIAMRPPWPIGEPLLNPDEPPEEE